MRPEGTMRNRREWIIGFLGALIVSGDLVAADDSPGVLEVTYYYLPG
jgi:hypothetical protein